ncbi:MAG: hypothetical protein M9962_15585 [Oligoflexia bacterium]|nr:hypothetical protein [Oligoflexia bacterium]
MQRKICQILICILSFVSTHTIAQAGLSTKKTRPLYLLAQNNNQAEDDLSSLGFSKEVTDSNPEEQALLETRSSMLQTHQYLGFVTLGLMTASLLTPESNLDLHKILGITTAVSYGATAYFSIFAPTPKDFESSGRTAWHKRLAWVHGIGMVLTPVFGLVRYNQKEAGKPITGVAKLHPVAAITTYAAFAGAMAIMTF